MLSCRLLVWYSIVRLDGDVPVGFLGVIMLGFRLDR